MRHLYLTLVMILSCCSIVADHCMTKPFLMMAEESCSTFCPLKNFLFLLLCTCSNNLIFCNSAYKSTNKVNLRIRPGNAHLEGMITNYLARVIQMRKLILSLPSTLNCMWQCTYIYVYVHLESTQFAGTF